MTLEELKIYNPVIDDNLYNETLKIVKNEEMALSLLNVVKNYTKKEEMIHLIKTGKEIAIYMKR